jgi:hypothetical protein
MVISADDLTLLFCIEAGALEPQGLLLCESIRTFGGKYKNSRILAIAPRPELAPSDETTLRLQQMAVEYRSLPLNNTGSAYGPINRIVAGAWAERSLSTEFIVVLDTDTAFLAEPTFFVADAGVRPVDVKGAASGGPHDHRDAYWAAICGFAGIALERLPMLETTASGQRIRASYNAGFTIVRRKAGILQQTERVFFAAYRAGYKTNPNARASVRASTGLVGLEASEWWGSSQAALAAAIWSSTRDVRVYDSRYNIPIHILARPDRDRHWPEMQGPPILVHYHYLLGPAFVSDLAAVLERIGCDRDTRAWMIERSKAFGPGLVSERPQ